MRIARFSAICSTAILLAAGASYAGTPTETAARQDDQQLICRAPVHEGMLMTQAKQCYTKAEWDARMRRMQYSVHEVQIRALTSNNH